MKEKFSVIQMLIHLYDHFHRFHQHLQMSWVKELNYIECMKSFIKWICSTQTFPPVVHNFFHFFLEQTFVNCAVEFHLI